MATTAKRLYPQAHPVMENAAFRERLLDLMWARIQKTIAPTGRPRARRRSNANLSIAGGIEVQEVLFEALDGVLRTDPADLRTTWEALATSIAHNKAVQAVRAKTKGRRRAGHEIDLASLDRPDEDGHTRAEELVDELADPEAEAIALQQELILRRLADQHLSERDREIYFRIHYLSQTRSDICDRFDLTAQAIGQIYTKSARRLHEAARQDPEFLRISDQDRGGNR